MPNFVKALRQKHTVHHADHLCTYFIGSRRLLLGVTNFVAKLIYPVQGIITVMLS